MKYTNNHNLPPALLDVISSLTYDITESDPLRVGITTLISPPRTRLLSVRHWADMEEDYADHIWRLLGNAVHYVLAKADKGDRLSEEKLIQVVDGITLVGKLDTYENKTKSIEDWKITSIWAVKLETKEEWIRQLNCYAWLLRKLGFVVEKGFINAIIKDWRKGESLKYSDYPRVPFMRIEVPIWSFEEQDKFIKERVADYKKALTLTDDELPVCSEKDRWKKEDIYAVYKNKNKTATKLHDTEEDAKKFILELGDNKNTYTIQKRPGVDSKCLDYCLCNKYCKYFKENYPNE